MENQIHQPIALFQYREFRFSGVQRPLFSDTNPNSIEDKRSKKKLMAYHIGCCTVEFPEVLWFIISLFCSFILTGLTTCCQQNLEQVH